MLVRPLASGIDERAGVTGETLACRTADGCANLAEITRRCWTQVACSCGGGLRFSYRDSDADQSEVENTQEFVQILLMTSYATTLDAADRLTLEEQEELADTLRRRIAEKRRAELVAAVKEARAEFVRGSCKPASVGAIMQRIRA